MSLANSAFFTSFDSKRSLITRRSFAFLPSRSDDEASQATRKRRARKRDAEHELETNGAGIRGVNKK